MIMISELKNEWNSHVVQLHDFIFVQNIFLDIWNQSVYFTNLFFHLKKTLNHNKLCEFDDLHFTHVIWQLAMFASLFFWVNLKFFWGVYIH
jgi:hypothetical protein